MRIEAAVANGDGQAQRIAVIGAGIIGAGIAYALRKRGADVVLFDRDEPGRGCSYGNLGAVSASSVVPLAMPGVIASLPAMLRDAESPLFLPLGYLPRALPWLLRFLASARRDKVSASSTALARLHAGAVAAHQALAAEVGVPELIVQRGQLHLYPDERARAKDDAGWSLRAAQGMRFEQLDRAAITDLEPEVGARYTVGMFLPDDATILNPLRYVQAIAAAFAARGGRLRHREIRALRRCEQDQWELVHDQGSERFARVVVAAGAWAPRLLAPLGIRLPLESQRGYHVQFPGCASLVSRSVVLADRKIFVAPMEDGLRVGGTVEIAGLDRPPDMRRARLLERIARDTFSGLAQAPATHWMGHRPCMPDSLPVIGRSAPGLWLAVGHGHLGMTDSANTAKLIADQMLEDSGRSQR
ncbi:MAG: NAD(P)/FAD-dependent oxidoreductase [Burkholderiaceae bacterium]